MKKKIGLYAKYTVIKNDTGEEEVGVFILKPEKDEAAVKAILAYADATENELLAAELREWVTSITPLGTYLDYSR